MRILVTHFQNSQCPSMAQAETLAALGQRMTSEQDLPHPAWLEEDIRTHEDRQKLRSRDRDEERTREKWEVLRKEGTETESENPRE